MNKFSWLKPAFALGAVFFLAILLVKPIGVSTQYSVLSGIFHKALDESVITEDATRDSGYISTNEYYDRNDGKLAEEIMNPWNYGFVLVLAIPLGAYASYAVNKRRRFSKMSDVGEGHINEDTGFIRRYLPAFLGGFLLLYGARLADGCTSGHMMSGMMQGSVSGYYFAVAAFATAIPAALIAEKVTQR